MGIEVNSVIPLKWEFPSIGKHTVLRGLVL